MKRTVENSLKRNKHPHPPNFGNDHQFWGITLKFSGKLYSLFFFLWNVYLYKALCKYAAAKGIYNPNITNKKAAKCSN